MFFAHSFGQSTVWLHIFHSVSVIVHLFFFKLKFCLVFSLAQHICLTNMFTDNISYCIFIWGIVKRWTFCKWPEIRANFSRSIAVKYFHTQQQKKTLEKRKFELNFHVWTGVFLNWINNCRFFCFSYPQKLFSLEMEISLSTQDNDYFYNSELFFFGGTTKLIYLWKRNRYTKIDSYFQHHRNEMVEWIIIHFYTQSLEKGSISYSCWIFTFEYLCGSKML